MFKKAFVKKRNKWTMFYRKNIKDNKWYLFVDINGRKREDLGGKFKTEDEVKAVVESMSEALKEQGFTEIESTINKFGI